MNQDSKKSEQGQGIGVGGMSAWVRQHAEERGRPAVTIIDRGASYERLVKEFGAQRVEHFAVIGSTRDGASGPKQR
jgi:shikimate 5-dehydrogenase